MSVQGCASGCVVSTNVWNRGVTRYPDQYLYRELGLVRLQLGGNAKQPGCEQRDEAAGHRVRSEIPGKAGLALGDSSTGQPSSYHRNVDRLGSFAITHGGTSS